MKNRKALNRIKKQRVGRVRAKVFGTSARPRLAVFRSNKGIYAQLIDDVHGKTITHASTRELSATDKKKKRAEQAALVGAELGKRALAAKIKNVIFDRRHYRYHGRVKALADGARKSGLVF